MISRPPTFTLIDAIHGMHQWVEIGAMPAVDQRPTLADSHAQKLAATCVDAHDLHTNATPQLSRISEHQGAEQLIGFPWRLR